MFDTTTGAGVWLLVCLSDNLKVAKECNLSRLPFRIGRNRECSLCIPSPSVSKLHCELVATADGVAVEDKQSTNGTYVNGERVGQRRELAPGDILQVGDCGFRVDWRIADEDSATCCRAASSGFILPAMSFLEDVMRDRQIVPHYQPIVALANPCSMTAYEVLIRGAVKHLRTPADLFAMARRLNLEARFSEMCRSEGARISQFLASPTMLYLNTHSIEVGSEDLIRSLVDLRALYPALNATVEVHEDVASDVDAIRRLRDVLTDLDMRLAFDDFGAGNARIQELAEVTPDVLKFDYCLIHDIHQAPSQRQRMISSIVRMVRDLGVEPLAEGIECSEEAAVCRELGFTMAQGYYFGKPESIDALRTRIRTESTRTERFRAAE